MGSARSCCVLGRSQAPASSPSQGCSGCGCTAAPGSCSCPRAQVHIQSGTGSSDSNLQNESDGNSLDSYHTHTATYCAVSEKRYLSKGCGMVSFEEPS